MSGSRLLFRSFAYAALLAATAATAQQPAFTEAGPIPPAVLSAKKIFLSNAGLGQNTYPDRFSGDSNRAYTQFYATLKDANQFELVSNPSDADLVMEVYLDLNVPPVILAERPTDIYLTPAPDYFFRLIIYDPKTHWVLWTINQGIAWADLQKNRDHNFDGALVVLMEKFQQLSGKPVTPFH
jgi:hypothetical protein